MSTCSRRSGLAERSGTLTLPELQQRVRYWQHKLRMHSWDFDVRLADATSSHRSDALATCSPHDHFASSTIEFTHQLFSAESERNPDEVIVHELLHALFRDYDKAARTLEDRLGYAIEELFHDRLLHEEERLVDHLARVLVALDKA